jgi:uncharacterized membrane-anchored protein YhcB (DUF1043 family)
MDDIKFAIGSVMGLIAGIIIGFVSATNREFSRSQEEIKKIDIELIERGLKYYHSKSGELVWKEEE